MRNPHKPIIIWLFTGCFLIFLMVMIGGITRLTHSGLSIAEWDLVRGTLPPLSQQAWEELFNKYKQTPEYRHINFDFTLADFKQIFWWEYIHRLLGRIIGLVFIIPFIYFLVKQRLSASLIKKLLIIFILGGLQGALGWYMVKSGLVNEPRVSHFRLAAHLVTAFISFGFTFWVALTLIYPYRLSDKLTKLKSLSWILLVVLAVQLIYGAFVAGLRAGKMYNTFPKMGDEWVAESVKFSFKSQGAASLFTNEASVQFVHRCLAFIIVFLVVLIFVRSKKYRLKHLQRTAVNYLLLIVLVQFLLGVFTLLYAVPAWLGVAHQLGAFALFANVIFLIHQLNYRR